MNELIQSVERRQLRKNPEFREGDRVRVHFQVIEGSRKRTQVFEGIVIKLQGAGARRTFTVRKLSFGVGVERTFPLHSPKIEQVEVAARGEVRRAKLYYLRGKIGKRARVRERRDLTPEEIEAMSGIVDDSSADAASSDENSPEDAPPTDETAAADDAQPSAEGDAPDAEGSGAGDPDGQPDEPAHAEAETESAEPAAEAESVDDGSEAPDAGSDDQPAGDSKGDG